MTWRRRPAVTFISRCRRSLFGAGAPPCSYFDPNSVHRKNVMTNLRRAEDRRRERGMNELGGVFGFLNGGSFGEISSFCLPKMLILQTCSKVPIENKNNHTFLLEDMTSGGFWINK